MYKISSSDKDILDNWHWHPPSPQQAERYKQINNETKKLAELLLTLCPKSTQRNRAIEQLQIVRMLGNAAIACNEKWNLE